MSFESFSVIVNRGLSVSITTSGFSVKSFVQDEHEKLETQQYDTIRSRIIINYYFGSYCFDMVTLVY